ncbi:hypothetical protein OH77DRAFT_738244 [Trametes cingulata]|nr:hypothetical protein OH77DRAFT_738244 [Trametes cingulata]
MAFLKMTGEATTVTWRDALSAAYTPDRMWVVTSPNVPFVPMPPTGILEVVLRADYRYGLVDPIQWPQVYSPGYEYLCAIQRPLPATHRLSPLWWTPSEDADFERVQGCTIKCLGLLRRESVRALGELVEEMSRLVADAVAAGKDFVDDRLMSLETAMRHSQDRLVNFPCTFRDAALQVRQVQRYWLMSRAFIDYYSVCKRGRERAIRGDRAPPVDVRFMGAFTTEPGVVQCLFEAGIPVWWIRQDASILEEIVIIEIRDVDEPRNICQRVGSDHGEVLYRGLVGTKHLQATVRGGHTYRDISRAPLLVVDYVGGYPAPMSHREYQQALVSADGSGYQPGRTQVHSNPAQGPRLNRSPGVASAVQAHTRAHPYARPSNARKSHGRGIDKFADLVHPWMPAALDVWRDVMAQVDQHAAGVQVNQGRWGYWIPDPGMFVRTQTEDRATRYFMTWLRVRPGWLYMLRVKDAALSRISPQWWRDFLYGDTGRADLKEGSRNALRASQFMHVFGQAFQREDLDLNPTAPPTWFGRRLPTLDRSLCPQILWEICELGFRVELLALDRLLVPLRDQRLTEEHREDLIASVFPDRAIYGVSKLPEEGCEGLSAQVPQRRAPYLEAFRCVLSRWPRCPRSIHDGVPITTALQRETIIVREREMVQYYVETFYRESGRAPIVPRAFPRA